jgi:orotidine-5'-phosphate decarboxylase
LKGDPVVPPLAVALDLAEREKALDLATHLLGRVAYVKVGLELYTAEGPRIIGELRELGHRVFLDLKLHDIPNTVSRAVSAAARAGAGLLTLHASGGEAMLSAAREAADRAAAAEEGGASGGRGLRLLGVTVLTSLDQAALAATGVAGHMNDQVLRLAALAATTGLDGVVASPREAAQLRAVHRPPFLLVTPGVRPTWAGKAHDQLRVATPRQAVLAGADIVVVGRPITAAPDPAAAADRVGAEIAGALLERGRPRPFGEAMGKERDD